MKKLLVLGFVFLISCSSVSPKFEKLAIGNCDGSPGIFIPMEQYGNFDAFGRIVCKEGYVHFVLIFNGKVITFIPVKTPDDKAINCENGKEPKVKLSF